MLPMDDGIYKSTPTGPTIVFKATFDNPTESNISVLDYTPEVGTPCEQLYSTDGSSKVVVVSSSAVVTPEDVLYAMANNQNPIFDSNIVHDSPSTLTLKNIGAVSGTFNLLMRLPDALAFNQVSGYMVRFVVPNFISVRSGSGVALGTLYGSGWNSSDIFRIEDDGTDNIGAIQVYRNDVLICSNNTGAVASLGGKFALGFGAVGHTINEVIFEQ